VLLRNAIDAATKARLDALRAKHVSNIELAPLAGLTVDTGDALFAPRSIRGAGTGGPPSASGSPIGAASGGR
jgi:hypothetical protein